MTHDDRVIANPKRKNILEESAKPIHVIREGAISASIYRRQSPSGYAYLDFSLTRSWKTQSSGKTGCSTNYFAINRQDLVTAIDRAAAWIAANEDLDAIAQPLKAAS